MDSAGIRCEKPRRVYHLFSYKLHLIVDVAVGCKYHIL